jgi:DNA primase
MRVEAQRAADLLFSEATDALAALRWLHERGLNDETLRRAHIGFNSDWRRTTFRDPQTGRPLGIAPGVLIPCSVDGALWAIHVRTLALPGMPPVATDLPKYLYVRGSKTGTLYNGDSVGAGCDVLIVEGEFDALLAQQEIGAEVAVVTMGSAANRLPRRWLDRLQQAERVYSCLDNDAAGQRATEYLGAALGKQHQALSLPEGKDVTDYVVTHGGNLADWWHGQTTPPDPEPVQQPLPGGFAQLMHGLSD